MPWKAIFIVNNRPLSLKTNQAFYPFYFKTFKLNVVIMHHRPMFIAEELATAFHKNSDICEYLLNFVRSNDILEVRKHEFKNTNLTILWFGYQLMPKFLLTIRGAEAFVNHVSPDNLWRMKYDIHIQITKPLHLELNTHGSQSLGRKNRHKKHVCKSYNYEYSNESIELIVLNELIRDLKSIVHSHNDRTLTNNRKTFIGISEIAYDDYNKSAYWLNKKLVSFGIQYKVHNHGPYHLSKPNLNYAELVYRRHRHTSLKWHPEGRRFIHKVMSNHGYFSK